MDITISETIGARVDGLHDWCAKSYPGEWTGPRTQVAREQVRFDGGLTVY
jgi:hypothetical protein